MSTHLPHNDLLMTPLKRINSFSRPFGKDITPTLEASVFVTTNLR